MSRWKQVERDIAEAFTDLTGTSSERVPITGRVRGSAPDVRNDYFGIEAKDRAKIPDYFKDMLHQPLGGETVIAQLPEDRLPGWIANGFDQAEKCRDNNKQIPVVIVHEKGMGINDNIVFMKSWWASRYLLIPGLKVPHKHIIFMRWSVFRRFITWAELKETV